MKINLNFLDEWSTSKTTIVSIALLIVPVMAVYFLLVERINYELVELTSREESLRGRLAKEKELFAKRVFLKQNLEALKKFETLANTQLPERKDMPMLLASVENLSKEIGLKVLAFIPQKENVKDSYAEIAIDIDVEGTFEQIQILVDELSRFTRIINVSDIKIFEPRGYAIEGRVQTSAKLKLLTFRQLTSEEKLAKQAKAKQTKNSESTPEEGGIKRILKD
ncbi:MAG: type 4a pilus biogenesis protein PilO [Deltaproteobacteria bacterium]|nr:type 4a pilus biogenesis protein PilO [Deltaproteobacteria bacterium]